MMGTPVNLLSTLPVIMLHVITLLPFRMADVLGMLVGIPLVVVPLVAVILVVVVLGECNSADQREGEGGNSKSFADVHGHGSSGTL